MLLGEEVTHICFGEGRITGQDGRYLTVRFGTESKVFVLPDIFERHMTFHSSALQAQMEEALRHTKQQREEEAAQRAARKQAERRGTVIAGNGAPWYRYPEEDFYPPDVY